MTSAQKISFCLLFVTVVILGIIVGTNWDILQTNTALYTQEQLENYGDQKFDEGMQQAGVSQELLDEYRAQIQEYQSNISELNVQLENLRQSDSANKEAIASLESQIDTFEKEADRLQELLDGYEQFADGARIVNFYVGEEKVKNVVLGKSIITLGSNNMPDAEYLKEAYSVKVLEWQDEDGNIITLSSNIPTDVVEYNVYATSITEYYDVTFVDFDTVRILDGDKISNYKYGPDNGLQLNLNDRYFEAYLPEKEGYYFTGWALNGVETSLNDIVVESDMTFTPIYVEATKLDVENDGFSIDPIESEFGNYVLDLSDKTEGSIIYTRIKNNTEITNLNNVVFGFEVDRGEDFSKQYWQQESFASDLTYGGMFTLRLSFEDDGILKIEIIDLYPDLDWKIQFSDFYELKGEQA